MLLDGWPSMQTVIALVAGGVGAAALVYTLAFRSPPTTTTTEPQEHEDAGTQTLRRGETYTRETMESQPTKVPSRVPLSSSRTYDTHDSGSSQEHVPPNDNESKETLLNQENCDEIPLSNRKTLGRKYEKEEDVSQGDEKESKTEPWKAGNCRSYIMDDVRNACNARNLTPLENVPPQLKVLEPEIQGYVASIIDDDMRVQNSMKPQAPFSRAYDDLRMQTSMRPQSQTKKSRTQLSVENLLTVRLRKAQQGCGRADFTPQNPLPCDPQNKKPKVQQAMSNAHLDVLYADLLSRKFKSNVSSHPDWEKENHRFPFLKYLCNLSDQDIHHKLSKKLNQPAASACEPDTRENDQEDMIDSLVRQLSEQSES